MPGTAAGTLRRKQRDARVGDLLGARLIGAIRARQHHVRLEQHALEQHALRVQLIEDRVQHLLGHR